jgi:O-antigen ligase
LTGLLIVYFIFAKIEDSLVLFIISIPLFVALPISEGFDSMANWRILLAVLFLSLLFKRGLSIKIIKDKFSNLKIKERLKHYTMEYLTGGLFVVSLLSLLVATDITAGIKKILFLINIFLLYLIIRNVIAFSKGAKTRIIKAGAAAGLISLAIGYSQILLVFIKPLFVFWQWWADKVALVFYGQSTSNLLAVSNSWFSYYPESPPTIRMFSIFPDSHSFALFTIISLIFFVYLSTKISRRWVGWAIIALAVLALLFSGSRGVWVSGLVPFCLLLFPSLHKKIKINGGLFSTYLKLFAQIFLIFLLAFPVSSFIVSQTYETGTDGALAFKRAKSIADMEELSVKSRLGIWQASFSSIIKHPLLGVGIGNYPVVLNEEISAAKRGASAHNLYLDIASEMGLLGLILLLLVFWQILKKSLLKPKHYNIIFAFFFTWILTYNLFDVVLLNDKVLLLFMVALGVLYSKKNEKK